MRPVLVLAILAMAATTAPAHRLDEYLQSTILSVNKTEVEAQMMLTPGVAVFSTVIAAIDTDGNAVISEAEQRNYAWQVLRDLSLTVDGHRLAPLLTAIHFPSIDDMKEGRGAIELDFSAALPPGGRNRELTLENHHHPRISAWQVNTLVPRDPDIRIDAQQRNYSQSLYQLDYTDHGVPANLSAASWSGALLWLSPAVLLLITWLSMRRKPRAHNSANGLSPATTAASDYSLGSERLD